jgi:hypothetical protein
MPGERMRLQKRLGAFTVLAALVVAGAVLSTHLGGSESSGAHSASVIARVPRAPHGPARPVPRRLVPPRPAAPLLVSLPARTSAAWSVVARVHGQPATWLAQRAGVTFMRFNQALVHLDLHAGSLDGGVNGWRYGDQITPGEIHLIVAAFNGGFKLSYREVGFMSDGHVAVPLRTGLASIVTYADGSTNVGAWRAGVPSARQQVFSVLQNQRLLVDHGAIAETTAGCVLACWGGTVENRGSVPRSGLGITADGQLVWAAGMHLLPAELGAALVSAGAVRAIELDINTDWVAGYLYVHHRGGPSPIPVVPAQHGIAGMLLKPDSRDFLTVVAN